MCMPPSTPHPATADFFLPGEVARRIEAANVQRATLPVRSLLLLGLLGGLYIAFGGALATLVLTDNGLGFGLGRLTAGLAFSLGLIMLVVAGGELFTGNNLMVVAYASRKISGRALLRNWVLAYAANAAGAILLAFAIHLCRSPRRQHRQGDGDQDCRGQGATGARGPLSCAAFSATCWCAWPCG